jgi:hypothetical protein
MEGRQDAHAQQRGPRHTHPPARRLTATNAQKEPRIPGATGFHRSPGRAVQASCGKRHMASPTAQGQRACGLGPRPSPTGCALRTWFATRSRSKSPAAEMGANTAGTEAGTDIGPGQLPLAAHSRRTQLLAPQRILERWGYCWGSAPWQWSSTDSVQYFISETMTVFNISSINYSLHCWWSEV